MPDAKQMRVNQYLEDTIAAERNFERALASFGNAGEQREVQQLLSSASVKARTQHARLTDLLEKRGGSPSTAKTVLAQVLAFTPLMAQMGQGAGEKNTQHLIVTYGAAAAEKAMYESLAAAATEAGDTEVQSLALKLQREEQEDADQVWSILQRSARESYQAEIARGNQPKDIIGRYLQDVIAAEKTFETQLLGFAKGEDDPTARTMFEHHARETKLQYEQLTSRLTALGGSTSAFKSIIAHLFGMSPKVAQTGQDAQERLTQNLMMAYAVENAEVAIYEALSEVCRTAGDTETERLARSIQKQEKETCEKFWSQLGRTAQAAIRSATQSA